MNNVADKKRKRYSLITTFKFITLNKSNLNSSTTRERIKIKIQPNPS